MKRANSNLIAETESKKEEDKSDISEHPLVSGDSSEEDVISSFDVIEWSSNRRIRKDDLREEYWQRTKLQNYDQEGKGRFVWGGETWFR